MYDRPTMTRHSSYSYPPQYAVHPQVQAQTQAQKQYPTAHSTSSAFSASANPNEDWTKISDLAERRRIQNRIAQRNYRKKLKKRLEDLERRAGSSSTSPEQRPKELAHPESATLNEATGSRPRSISSQMQRDRTPDMVPQHYVLPPTDDRSMFAQQYTRQLSTSPPPFSYASLASNEDASYAEYPQPNPYCTMPSNMDLPLYPSYLPPMQQSYNGLAAQPVKQEFYGDDEMSPFSMGYASIAGVDATVAQSYQDITAYTPSLSESFDHSQAGSPPELTTCPRTPAPMSRTPPMHLYDA